MKELCFVPVLGPCPPGSELHRLNPVECSGSVQEVWCVDGASLTFMEPDVPRHDAGDVHLATLLCNGDPRTDPLWWLIPRNSDLMINGSHPLPIAAVEPGQLMSWGRNTWMVTTVWTPEPITVPEKLAEQQCPVCGGPLGAAPVIMCGCGRYYHLENPEVPDDPNALNCYLRAGACGLCKREPVLTPQLVPEPHERLFDPEPAFGMH